MPKKQAGGRKRRKHKKKKAVMQDGGNIFHDIGDGFTKAANWTVGAANTVANGVKDAHDFVKRKKIVSRVLDAIPHPGAKIGSIVTDAVGYGRRQRGGARMSAGPGGFGNHVSTPLGGSMTGSVSPAVIRF